ncbi:potassium voltage-gated channel protein egl-36-like [Lineus longissimus]|uniref:potassium voltage-gated channel protein egl-36-like n=1 Tax=Lineus longissimus TaxID=88925 RepID=UPI00315D90D9
MVRVNVGGSQFLIGACFLSRYPDSTLSLAVSENRNYDELTSCYVFDRNPEFFNSILDCYRLGQYHIPQNGCAMSLKADFRYWKLPLDAISPCCIRKILEAEEEAATVTILKAEIVGPLQQCRKEMESSKGWQKIKLQTWMFMEYPRYSVFAKIWSIMYAVLVLISCIILALLTDHKGGLYNPEELSEVNRHRCLYEDWRKYVGSQAIYCNFVGVVPLRILDIFVNLIFTVDFVVRLVVSPSKCNFFKNFMNWVDILTIVSFYVAWILMVIGNAVLIEEMGTALLEIAGVCFAIQTLRLIRLLKISRWVLGLRVFGLILKRSVHCLLTIIWLLVMGAVFFAFAAYIVDINSSSKGDGLPRVYEGLYFALITITTVGYGDVLPTTIGTRIVATACAIFGIILAGLSIPILGSSFNLYFGYISQYMKGEQSITIDWLGYDVPEEECDLRHCDEIDEEEEDFGTSQ